MGYLHHAAAARSRNLLPFLQVIVFCTLSVSAFCSISCHNQLNISLDNDCQSQLSAMDILTHGNTGGPYTLELSTANGTVLAPSNIVDESHLWTTLMAKVTDTSTGNSCWGSVHVEDKLGPTITCADITIDCYDMNTYEPTADDACTTSTVSIVNQSITVLPCTDDNLKEIQQTYQATDSYGNTSNCTQSITLRRFDMTTIDWPEDFELINDTNLTCKDEVNDEGNPDISVTGVPTSNGVALFPYDDFYCNIAVEFRDVVIADFGCAKKIMRTWYVYDWNCNNTSASVNHVQTIEIDDTELPVISNCPSSIIMDADGSAGCQRTLELTLPTVTDDCSGFLEIDVAYNGGFVNNATANPVVTLSGSSMVTYTVYDRCDNSASCSTVVTIRDNESPTAVCDQNTIVSLRSDGTARAYARSFDDGSFDDCELYKTLVKRVSPDCGCDRPYFDDMTYLGDHDGHFYYLSDDKTTGPWAGGLATGLDGQLVSLESEAEANWIIDAALAITDSFYIGLTDEGHPGSFLWSDHSAPTYTNWADGQVDAEGSPLVAGSYVVVNEGGEWEIIGGGDRLRYIVEISDACGFSDRVDFCCSDASAQQTVLFRAIDISGRINECTSLVTVQDKIAPVISCPADVTVACGSGFDPNNSSIYGTATATDQCTSQITFELSNNVDPTCQTGSILKVWTAGDQNGSSSCTQTFSIESASGYDPDNIVWPEDYDVVGGCDENNYLPQDLPIENGFPQYSTGLCDNVSQNYSDAVFSFAGPASDACSKIVRTWTVTDHCAPLVDGQNPQIYQQAIKVNNTTAPTINNCEPISVNTADCNPINVKFSATALDDCAPNTNVDGTIVVDVFSDGNFESSNSSQGNIVYFNRDLPVGTHSAIISFTDRCGNVANCSKMIQVTNVTTPSVVCKNSVSVNIQAMDLDSDPNTPPENMAIVNTGNLVLSTSNPCGYNVSYSFSASNQNDNQRTFDCTFRNTTQALTVYVTDSFGLGSSCTSTVQIQDNNNLCGQPPVTNTVINGCEDQTFEIIDCPVGSLSFSTSITGSGCSIDGEYLVVANIDFNRDGANDIREDLISSGIYTYDFPTPVGSHELELTYSDPCGVVLTCVKNFTVTCTQGIEQALIVGSVETEMSQAVQDVEVALQGAGNTKVMTDDSGSYAFPAMQTGGEYKVTAVKNENPLNGVSTLDLIAIQRNILGIKQLDSPYKLIAADVDRSGDVNGIDLIELRKLILGIYDDFPNNTSWRMIDASVDFADPANPFADSIQEDYAINKLDDNMEVDFVGVKVGDVNNSAELLGSKRIEERASYSLELQTKSNSAREYEITINSGDLEIEGFQLEFLIDGSRATVQNIIPLVAGLNEANISNTFEVNDKVTMSWYTQQPVAKHTALFRIELAANSESDAEAAISLETSRIANEIYHNNSAKQIQLEFRTTQMSSEDQIMLYPNRPNPWSETTEISYYLPSAKDIILSVYDINGKLIYQEQKRGYQGINTVLLSRNDLLSAGVLYYELVADNISKIQKMVVIE